MPGINIADINQVLTLTGVLMRLVNEGLLTASRVRSIAADAGATPAELAEMDRRLSDAIAEREHDLGLVSEEHGG